MDVAESDEVGIISDDGDCENKTVERSPSKNSNWAIGYLTPKARLEFNKLRKTFTKAPILQHFDPECHIEIKIDVTSCAIGEVLSQLILDDLGQWHLVAYYSRKMILVKTWYKTHDSKLLAIVEAFKTWRHYLEGCKYKVLILTNYNNLCHFMDTKSLSFRHVHWV